MILLFCVYIEKIFYFLDILKGVQAMAQTQTQAQRVTDRHRTLETVE